jgi:hypothetical protein
MKRYIGAFFKIVIAMVVIAFLGLKSLDFFYYVTPADQFYYAYLGFGLTGGAVIAYLAIFLWDADTDLRRSIAVGMLVVSVLGELASAGFGLQINAWLKNGWTMTAADFDWMILVVQILGFFHAAALILYIAGDQIIWAFGDEDGDGTINAVDPVNNKTGQSTQRRKFSLFGKKKEPVRQLETIKQITIDENIYKQLLIDAGVGQGSANGNGHKAEKDFTNPPRR